MIYIFIYSFSIETSSRTQVDAKISYNGQRGNSERSERRHQQNKSELHDVGKSNGSTLENFFCTGKSNTATDYDFNIEDEDVGETTTLPKESTYRTASNPKIGYKKAIDYLFKHGAEIIKEKRKEAKRKKVTSSFQHTQSIAVASYLQLLCDGAGKLHASEQVARVLFPQKFNAKLRSTKNSYIVRSIRIWADQFLDDGRIKDSGQGKHMRILHILTSKKVQQQLRDHLKDMAVLDRYRMM